MTYDNILLVIAGLRLAAIDFDMWEEYFDLVELEKFILAEPEVYH